jgi:hypothetical protein
MIQVVPRTAQCVNALRRAVQAVACVGVCASGSALKALGYVFQSYGGSFSQVEGLAGEAWTVKRSPEEGRCECATHSCELSSASKMKFFRSIL